MAVITPVLLTARRCGCKSNTAAAAATVTKAAFGSATAAARPRTSEKKLESAALAATTSTEADATGTSSPAAALVATAAGRALETVAAAGGGRSTAASEQTRSFTVVKETHSFPANTTATATTSIVSACESFSFPASLFSFFCFKAVATRQPSVLFRSHASPLLREPTCVGQSKKKPFWRGSGASERTSNARFVPGPLFRYSAARAGAFFENTQAAAIPPTTASNARTVTTAAASDTLAKVSSSGTPSAVTLAENTRAIPFGKDLKTTSFLSRGVVQAAIEEVRAAGSVGLALNERIVDIYAGEEAVQELKTKRKKSHPFFRPVEGIERCLFACETEVLLRDPVLTRISLARSAKYCVPLPNDHRPPLQSFLFDKFLKHREYSNTAWRFMHLILERTEAEHLHAVFAIPKGFNGRFYFFLLHLWLLHKRLSYGVNRNWQVEKQRQALHAKTQQRVFFEQNSRTGLLLGAVAKAQGLLPATWRGISAAKTKTAKTPSTSQTFGQTTEVLAAAKSTTRSETAVAAAAIGSEAESICSTASKNLSVDETLSFEPTRERKKKNGGIVMPQEPSVVQGMQFDAALVKLRHMLHTLTIADEFLVDKGAVVAGEMLDDALFKLTWDVVKDWLMLKKVAEARFEVELRNCQEHAFGFFAALDEALMDEEIYASRIKEALWGNFYSGRIGYDDRHLHLLTKYTIRQLTHLMHIPKQHFYQAYFTWADFFVSAQSPAPRVVPALAQHVRYGGYSPEIAGVAGALKGIGGKPLPQQLTAGSSKERLRAFLTQLQSILGFSKKLSKV